MTSAPQALTYVRQDRNPRELHMTFNTDHLDLYGGFDTGTPPVRDLPMFKSITGAWQTYMYEHGGWNSIDLESHDHPRSIGRFMNEEQEHRAMSAKALRVLLTTLSGTLFMYQGQEIGMINVPHDWPIEEYPDVATQYHYTDQLQRRRHLEKTANPDMTGVMGSIRRKARDNARIPMQWDSSLHGGFTTGKPWMRSSSDAEICNAAAQRDDPSSVLNFWKKMIANA